MQFENCDMSTTLKFLDPGLEEAYIQEAVLNNHFVPRLIYLGGAFLYAIFFMLDMFFLKEILRYCVFIRFFLVCPLLLSIYFLIGSPIYKKHHTAISVIAGFVSGGGLLFMIANAPSPAEHLYYAGLMLCCLFYYVFQPRQLLSNSLSWGMFFLYIAVSLAYTEVPGAILLNNLFIFFFFNIGGMFACYAMELTQRKEFIHKCTMEDQSYRLYQALEEVDGQREKAERLSLQDPLTGLPNRRHFFSVLREALEPGHRDGQELSLMLIDIDYFKEVNDQLGHMAGDEVLAIVAHIIGDSVRQCDTACRYGGEEFAVLLPGASSQTVETIGRRLMEKIESADLLAGRSEVSLTVSVGFVSLSPGSKISIEEVIGRADRALYEAKNSGRNQLRMWSSDSHGCCV
ncbi:diguanylate cyclase [Syntrophotalea carbinolica DSM 2380]|uniref:diguanylate cyclase n=1 Tax=Syntrophotalea carbinolica (strain DSM 2380 / NBRC 103641 / GraBd1) TaxID=338963 RepID=Q3A2B9_SYNC1|nr:GGDEF domain-containing protein [Syntrophotalea carbinolica]ABA89488.1 diguanylate cyclase [Syntrophotalea carbinolica DSM 2380]